MLRTNDIAHLGTFVQYIYWNDEVARQQEQEIKNIPINYRISLLMPLIDAQKEKEKELKRYGYLSRICSSSPQSIWNLSLPELALYNKALDSLGKIIKEI
jgi:hypothetical protein